MSRQLKIRLTLLQRLRRHVGRNVSLVAKDFASEPGLLQSVGRQFIRVTGQLFVPSTLDQIFLHALAARTSTIRVSIRTTFRGTFTAGLVHVGTDYIEIIERRNKTLVKSLIPLNKIVSLERV
ncbi:hypothetical protein [Ammoniphilus sp. YIM 78166]|uniref:hypothetical protein n=1 Tax=Ammoniphilus sp. YIM 78166 TaxID=1644106 RepID=UPI00106FB047|nr:hypothetical protein [Ammoniphilus sp. YIM 78166]